MKYYPFIGIEVHLELQTKSKMFCDCRAEHFRVKPNIHTCPVCLGLPGALPVPNKKAIEWCLLIGLALNCQVAKESKFDRKNYFYPDLPKGYQISQYDAPFSKNGFLTINFNGREKKIAINRVHMEEDTGKLLHKTIKGKTCTLIDFNRSGVPLVEVVSQPDINSSQEAVTYLKKLQQIIRYLGVSDCDMEKGSMRGEINISLVPESKIKTQNLGSYKVEVKNLNSFRFVKKTIDYEIGRQREILESGKIPVQETRGFDEKSGKTFSQRTKEEAHDYRYFPEPDIPAIKWENKEIEKLKKSLPELPDQKIKRFIQDYGLIKYNARILVTDKQTADYFDQIVKLVDNIKSLPEVAKIIVNKKVNINKYSPRQLIDYLNKQKKSKLTDKKQLTRVVEKILKENKKAVLDYKKGKKEVIGYLIGRVMAETKGKAAAQVVEKIIVEKIKSAT